MNRSDQPKARPTTTLRESTVLGEPATVDRCADDYKSGASTRKAVDADARRRWS